MHQRRNGTQRSQDKRPQNEWDSKRHGIVGQNSNMSVQYRQLDLGCLGSRGLTNIA